jgi:hypothetical protein
MPEWTDDEIAVIKQGLEAGDSAGMIATKLRDRSRNAVIGKVLRDATLSKIGFARESNGRGKHGGLKPSAAAGTRPVRPLPRRKPVKTAKPRDASEPPAAKAPPVRTVAVDAAAYDAKSLHLPLADLRSDQCRWPVNDAVGGEVHLFCGHAIARTRETQPPYCKHHQARHTGREDFDVLAPESEDA